MICCNECFNDLIIRASIESSNHKGDCPVCGKKNVWLYDSETDQYESDFEELLTSIIDIYAPEEYLDNDFPEIDKKPIEQHIIEDWELFSTNLNNDQVKIIIQEIINNAIELDNNLYLQRVGIPELHDEAYLNEHSIMGKYDWDTFKYNLRSVNRFHSSYINLEVLEQLLSDMAIIIPSGYKLYRSRVSNEVGFKGKEMGAPPSAIATAGRANSKGISCLYLSSSKDTTVKEIRASAFDYVTIATFRLLEDIKIIDLSNITHNLLHFPAPYCRADTNNLLNSTSYASDIPLLDI